MGTESLSSHNVHSPCWSTDRLSTLIQQKTDQKYRSIHHIKYTIHRSMRRSLRTTSSIRLFAVSDKLRGIGIHQPRVRVLTKLPNTNRIKLVRQHIYLGVFQALEITRLAWPSCALFHGMTFNVSCGGHVDKSNFSSHGG